MPPTAPRRWFSIRPSLLALTAVVATLIVVALCMVDVTPPGSRTSGAVIATSWLTEHYWNEHHQLPPDLAALPGLDGRPANTTDGWSRPLEYTVVSPDTFTLTSLGRDGQPGGQGDDADCSKTYRILDGQRHELPQPESPQRRSGR